MNEKNFYQQTVHDIEYKPVMSHEFFVNWVRSQSFTEYTDKEILDSILTYCAFGGV